MSQQTGQGGRDGLSAWAGVLDAFREAIEETVEELRQRSDIDPDRAKEAMRSGMKRAESAFDDVRDRFDFVPRRDYELLRADVEALRRRIDRLESGPPQIPVDAG